MKSIKFLLALVTLVMSFSTCSENDPSIVPEQKLPKPEPTPVGIPNGIPNSMTIGVSGGTIVSLDGLMGIEIPAGALSADTEISIQPTTNFIPNGNEHAYRLGPEGIKFNIPIKITFKYGQGTSPTMPTITGIAFQDTDGIWYSSGKFTFDEVNKTVSTETTHFSSWGTFDDLRIVPVDYHTTKFRKDGRPFYQLKVNESAQFKLIVIGNLDPKLGEELSPLVPRPYREDLGGIIKAWSINGDVNGKPSKYGEISVSEEDSVCTYTAPEKQPEASKNPVQLSVDIRNLKYKDRKTGQVFNDLMVNTQIEITGELKFNLEFRYDNAFVSGGLGDFNNSDLVKLKVFVKDGQVIVSDIINANGTIIPASFTRNTCTSTWLPQEDSFPGITATEATGDTFSDIEDQSKQYFYVAIKGDYQHPRWKITCGNSPPTFQGGESSSGGPLSTATFVLKDSAQFVLGSTTTWFAKLTPE